VYSVDIDVGGTLTDGIFTDGTRLVCAKVDTTSHDVTVCLFDCLTQGANQLGFTDLTGFLEQVELLRWSTTITSNVLAERSGPKIGLIVSKGHEKDLYGQGPSPALKIIREEDVIGLDADGGAQVLGAVRSLLENGVRRICVSLGGALQDPERELLIKRIIEEQYPDHYLGSVPVLTGSDICKNTDDMTRTYYAIINAYTHSALAATLFKAEDELRYTQGYSRAFLISHINGGVAGVSKTRAVDTMESGPILGLYGASYLAKSYGVRNVIALDVGGTTAKLGVIQNGEPVYSHEGDLFGIPVRTKLPYLRSIALGGGSVAHVRDGHIELGPESMGSFPGPACYGLGGEHPTLTDAFVTAGLIDPDYFLAGAKQLDLELARGAINNAIARPLGMSVQEACREIVDRAYDMVAAMIASARQDLQQDLGDHVLFAYGGNGGLFACGVAQRAGIDRVFMFALGPVFSAFGSSVSDIVHVYEEPLHLSMINGDVAHLNRAVERMRAAGIRDLQGESIKPDDAQFSIELELSNPCASGVQVKCPTQSFDNIEQLRAMIASQTGPKHTKVEVVRMHVRKSIARPALLDKQTTPQPLGSVANGTRTVAYGSEQHKASIHKWESLQPGNQVQGCALLESGHSTYFVPEGWSLTIDRFGNAQVASHAEKTLQTSTSGAVKESGYGN
jgi:acetophenone carboxylase